MDVTEEVTATLRAEAHHPPCVMEAAGFCTLGCNNDQTLFVPKCYGVCSKASHSMMSDNPHWSYLHNRFRSPLCNWSNMKNIGKWPCYLTGSE